MNTLYRLKPSDVLNENLHFSAAARDYLKQYDRWWQEEGSAISDTVDRSRTPWLKLYNTKGERIDEIGYPSEYWKMLHKGYDSGIIWRVFEEKSLLPFFHLGYICSYYGTGLFCPYTVSLSTAAPIFKYGNTALKKKFLEPMLAKTNAWQGATWFTEIKGGSDLANNTDTVATKKQNDLWLLNGEKYFCSNMGAEVSVVSAMLDGSKKGFDGLQMFVMPKISSKGKLNYFARRIKDKIGTRSVPTGELELKNSEAYLLDEKIPGIYLIMEVLNISRIANTMGSVALAHRAFAEAYSFAEHRVAFGKPVLEQPLLHREFEEKSAQLDEAFRFAFYAAGLLNKVWQLKPPYTEEYHFFRLIAHIGKFYTAELAVQTAKWSMEVHGGIGILEEFGIERLLREAMILQIWEGTPHRQMLDGLKVLLRKDVQERLLDELKPVLNDEEFSLLAHDIQTLEEFSQPERERTIGKIFSRVSALVVKGYAILSGEKVKPLT
ncbi:MAG TPA: acyl-CoA dehydrogenase family protein [Chitinophagales bacterium]|nr:acyl-CoA dehydrogenase family protein [Chitinophagales bacterium]